MLRSINEETHGRDSVGSLRSLPEHLMAIPAPRKRKAAVPQNERTVKTSMILGVDLYTRLAAAAAMQGKTQNAIVVEILTDALGGIVVFDRRKAADRLRIDGSARPGADVDPEGEEAA
jgi:hypothetical protein